MVDPELRPRRVVAALAVAALVVAAAVGCAFALLRAWQLPAAGDTGSAALVSGIPAPRLQTAPQLERQMEQSLGTRVPAARLRDSQGRPLDWQALADDGRPIVLLPAYYRCDMLCGTAAHGALEALADTGLPADRWHLLLFSADPEDTPAEAATLRRVYLDYARFARPAAYGGTAPDLRLLTGPEAETGPLARAVGFSFQRTPDGAFAHPTGLVVLTAGGIVSRLLPGVRYEPRTLRAALVEASAGRVGTFTDRLLLACSRFEPQGHGGAVMAAVRGGVLLAVAILALWLGLLWRRARR